MSSLGPVLSRSRPSLPGGGSVPPRKPPASSAARPAREPLFISLSLVFRSFTGNGFIARDLICNSPTGGFFSCGREKLRSAAAQPERRDYRKRSHHRMRIYTRVYACMSIHIYKCISIYTSRSEVEDLQKRPQRSV